jgi:hypothetical protein
MGQRWEAISLEGSELMVMTHKRQWVKLVGGGQILAKLVRTMVRVRKTPGVGRQRLESGYGC